MGENSSFGFLRVGLCVGKNQMCHLCGGLFLAGVKRMCMKRALLFQVLIKVIIFAKVPV
jgi:hypothetical protein